jgi:hypothetical protein
MCCISGGILVPTHETKVTRIERDPYQQLTCEEADAIYELKVMKGCR